MKSSIVVNLTSAKSIRGNVKLAKQEREMVMANFIFRGGNLHDCWHIACEHEPNSLYFRQFKSRNCHVRRLVLHTLN